ncbi:MAG: hypothetical protein GXO91_01005 [FCB group bacterium]|nr:hypothetical protein [FCB group bacterium]
MEDNNNLKAIIQSTFKTGVDSLAGIFNSKIIQNSDPDYTAFVIPTGGLCLMGLHQIGSKGDYVDIRWRVLIGEVTTEFDCDKILEANFEMPETCYSIFNFNDKKILAITDIYRFLIAWGMDDIVDIMKIRFGSVFSVPLSLPSISTLSGDLIEKILFKYKPKQLLGE